MILLQVDTRGPEEMLRIVGDNLGDLTEPLTKVGEQPGLEDARAQIEGQGSLFGGAPWPEMSPWTIIVALAQGRERTPGTLLKDSGGLLASLEPGGPENIFEVGQFEATFGTRYSGKSGFPVASVLQEGSSVTFHVLQGEGFSPGGYPGRDFLSWYNERVEEYDRIFADHVVKGLE